VRAVTEGKPEMEGDKRIEGDPGVGGVLADPEEPVSKPEHAVEIKDRSPTPDPQPPRAHGDWPPNRAWRGARKP
jgi:hypothetical protein